MTTPNFSIPEVNTGVLNYTTLNTILRHYEQTSHLVVESVESTPPTAPGDGLAYLVGSSPTGVFVGREGEIAFSVGGTYNYLTPVVGFTIHDKSVGNDLRYTGTAWLASPTFSRSEATYSASSTLDYASYVVLDVNVPSLTATLPIVPEGYSIKLVNIGTEDLAVDYSGSTDNVLAGTNRLYLMVSTGWIIS